MTSKTNPKIPKDLGVKMGSPAMKFWHSVIDNTKGQLEAAADATSYNSAVLAMAQEKYSKAVELYNSTTKK